MIPPTTVAAVLLGILLVFVYVNPLRLRQCKCLCVCKYNITDTGS